MNLPKIQKENKSNPRSKEGKKSSSFIKLNICSGKDSNSKSINNNCNNSIDHECNETIIENNNENMKININDDIMNKVKQRIIPKIDRSSDCFEGKFCVINENNKNSKFIDVKKIELDNNLINQKSIKNKENNYSQNHFTNENESTNYKNLKNLDLSFINNKDKTNPKLSLHNQSNYDLERDPSFNKNQLIYKISDDKQGKTNFNLFQSKIPNIKNLEKNFSPSSINTSKTASNNIGYNTSQNYKIQINYNNNEVTNINNSKENSKIAIHNIKDKNKEFLGKDLKIKFNEIFVKNKVSSNSKDTNKVNNGKNDKNFSNSISRQYTTNLLKMQENLNITKNPKYHLGREIINNSNHTNSLISNKNKNLSSIYDRDSSQEGNSKMKLKNFYRHNTDLDENQKIINESNDKDEFKNFNSFNKNSIIKEEKETKNPFDKINNEDQ